MFEVGPLLGFFGLGGTIPKFISYQTRLPRPLSNHFRITLERAKLERGNVPFKFENMWLKAKGFSNLIKKWCEEVEVEGFASLVLARKLKFVKEELKKWNKEVFGDVKLRKYKLLDFVNALDMKEESDALSNDEIDQKREGKEELARVLQMEGISFLGGKSQGVCGL